MYARGSPPYIQTAKGAAAISRRGGFYIRPRWFPQTGAFVRPRAGHARPLQGCNSPGRDDLFADVCHSGKVRGSPPHIQTAKGVAAISRRGGFYIRPGWFPQTGAFRQAAGRACPARGLTESARLREPPRADIESAPTGNRSHPFCGLYVGRRTANFPAMADVRKKVIPPGTIATL